MGGKSVLPTVELEPEQQQYQLQAIITFIQKITLSPENEKP